MFDLHLHTTCSDGTLHIEELLELLQKEKIRLFSITDHNHCLAYQHFDPSLYQVLPGTELATSYQGTIIEVLGYGVDPNTINSWYAEFFSDDQLRQKELLLFNRLKKMASKEQLALTADLKLPSFKKGISKQTVYQDLIKQNPAFLEEFPTYKQFFRRGLSNPQSSYFLNEAITYPSLAEVVELIHSANGKAFLAHPYEYGMDVSELQDLSRQMLDGIECFHPSASMVQSLALFAYCETQHLLASGGSDFHKPERKIRVGVRIAQELLAKKPLAWLYDYISKESIYEQ